MVTPKLKTEQNTRVMERRVKAAAQRVLGTGSYQADFEHGQWWVTVLTTGAQYSAVDSTGANTYDGFAFEQVTKGDGE